MKLKLSYRPFRVLMADRNITRKDLSESLGINRNTIGRLFNDVEVSLDTVRQICEYLDCRIEDVVEFVPESPSFEDRTRSFTDEQIRMINEQAHELNPKYRTRDEA